MHSRQAILAFDVKNEIFNAIRNTSAGDTIAVVVDDDDDDDDDDDEEEEEEEEEEESDDEDDVLSLHISISISIISLHLLSNVERCVKISFKSSSRDSRANTAAVHN